MARTSARDAVVQVGEFALGTTAAYLVVGAAWAATATVWAPTLVAAGLVALAVAMVIRFGPKVTGLVAGLMPTAVLTAGALTALTLVLTHLRS